jgi:PAS domain S-box-containing protein
MGSSMGLAVILFLGGFVIILWLYFWTRQRQHLGPMPEVEQQILQDVPLASSDDAVLVSKEHGQLVFVNERARRWLDMNGGDPSLEYIAQMAQPADSFLELFAGEGQSSFQLGSRWVEASSHRIPTGAEMRTVVVMRELSANTHHPDVLDLSLAMSVINEIGDTVNASLSIEQVLQALLAIVTKAIPADAGEICVWEETERVLYPRGWLGDMAYILALSESGGRYALGEGITGWIAQYRKPVLVSDIRDATAIQPKLDSFYQSYVGVPLTLGERFVGTFELSRGQSSHFSRADVALLQAVSKQIATAIYNAELYSTQTRRINDMSGLQQVTQQQENIEDARAVYATLTERMARLMSADMCGILLYDENRRSLVAEPPFFGLADHVIANYAIPLVPDSPQLDIWENQQYWVSNDIADEPLVEAMGLQALVSAAGVYNAALVPMQIGDRRIGIVQVSNKRTTGGFTGQDIQDLRMLVTQAAIAVENIRLFQREQRRDSEFLGLQELTHAISALSHESAFYSTITERIASLMEIEMCGVMLFDEESHRLAAQMPFFGVDNALINGYGIELKPGSALWQIWNEENYWYTNNVATDMLVFEAGLGDLAEVIGVKKTLMAVLAVGGHRLGVVQVSNKVKGEDFNDKDARLLLVFAAQAAAIIENARLYREMQRRAQEADSLRKVAEMAASTLTTEEPFTPVLAEIARLTNSPLVFVNVLDQQASSLITYPRWVYGLELHEPVVQDMLTKDFKYSVAMLHRAYSTNDVKNDQRMIESYRTLAQKLGITRMLLVPLTVGERSLGELGVANRERPQYGDDDERLMMAVGAQIAATIDRLLLYESTGQNLTRRVQELDAISRVSNELTLTLELDRILDVIREEAAQATGADDSTVALLKPTAQWKKANRPEMERRLGEQKGMSGLADIEQEAITRGADAVLVADYENSPMKAFPKETRSGIAAAITYADEVVGVIHLYHSLPNMFDDRASTFLVTLAAKASLGYGNALRYREQMDRSSKMRRRVDQLNQIFELGHVLQSNVDQVTVLEAIADSIQQSVGYDVVVIALLDEDAGVLRRVAQAGMPVDAFEHSKVNTIELERLHEIFHPDNRTSESYFFPAEQRERWYAPDLIALSTAFDGNRVIDADGADAWNDGDMLLVPMAGAGGDLLGVISLDRPDDNRRPDRSIYEILEIFSHQASRTIENTRLYLSSVHSAEQEGRLNEMMEAIASNLDMNAVVEAMARGALRLVPFMQMTVALQDADQQGFDVVKVTVNTDSTLALSRDHRHHLNDTALGRTFTDSQDYLYYAGDRETGRYEDLKAWNQAGERTTLIVPMIAGGETVGAVHLGSDLVKAFGFNEFRPLLKRMAHLSAVAMQNARLFNRAVNLQSFNESVVESIQQGIIVLDRSGRIISVNDFMKRRYGWDDTALRQDLFAYRPHLAGFLAEDVRLVLDKGEHRERIGQTTRDQSGEPLVRNFYTYPLRDAESVRGAVLLVEDVTERTRLEQDLEARANQLAALTEVSSRITASLDRQAVMSLALGEMERVIAYDTMTLWTRKGEFLVFEGGRGFTDDDLVFPARPVEIDSHERLRQVVETKQVFTINHLQGWDPLPGEMGAQSWMGIPLVNQGYVVGMICLTKSQTIFYNQQAQQAAFAFANQVAVALTNADLFAETQRRTQRLSLLNRVSVSLAQSLDSENILEIALREIAQILSVEQARAVMIERDLNLGRVIVEYPRGDSPPDDILKLQKSPAYQQVRRTAVPIIYEDTRQNGGKDDPILEEVVARGVTAYVLIPMSVGGQIIGAFELENHASPRAFSADQIDLSQIIANQAAISVQNTSLLEQTLVRTRELETLLEAAQATSLSLNLDEVFRSVVELMLHALDMDDCAIMIWDDVENTLEVQMDISRSGDPDRLTPEGATFNLSEHPAKQHALREREVVVIQASDESAFPEEVRDLREHNDTARMLVPLVVRDQSIGLIQVEMQTVGRMFTHQDIRLAQALGAQAAIAIQNARLSTETAAHLEESFAINDISQAISSTIDIDTMIRVVRDQVPNVTGAEGLYLALYDSETEEISFPLAVKEGQSYEIPPRKLTSDEVSFIIRYRSSLPLGTGNWTPDEERKNLGITNAEGEVQSYLGVPLVASGQVLGVLALRDTRHPRAFGMNDQRILTTVATQLGAAIQNARSFDRIRNFADDLNRRVQERTAELQQERDRIDTLYQITAELARTLDMNRVLRRALEMVANAVAADEGVIMLVDPMTDRLYNRAALRFQPEPAADGEAKPTHPAEGLATWLIHSETNEHALVVDDLRKEDYWNPKLPGAKEWRSAMAVLLETNDDVLGVLVLLSSRKKVFTAPHVRLVVAAANQVASAINNADLYHLIRDQAEKLGTLLRAEQEQAEKSSAILESIADGVMLADSDGVIVLFNDAAQRILELPRDHVLGQRLTNLTGIYGGSAAVWANAINEWAQNPQRHSSGDFLSERLDLGERVVSVHLSPVHIGDSFLGTVSVFRDITIDVEVDRIKSEFVSNVSHELRTPMTSIKGYADLLLMGAAGQVSEMQERFLKTIKSNADRLSILVNDLLNISKLDAGEALNLEYVELDRLLPSVVANVQTQTDHERKHMQVAIEVETNLPPVRADLHKLTQIITNVVDNAFNYTYPGGSIEINAQPQANETVLISIKDSGIGIPEEFRSRIWERFERYEEHALVMDVAGTGLGLPIVKKLVEMHNGLIWFESEMGKGTTFFIELPVEQPESKIKAPTGHLN